MLSEFEAINYKQFSKIKLKDLSLINIIAGKNNCGKSSLLEAIFTLFDRGSPDLTIKQFAWRGIGSVPFDKDGVWAPIFHKYNLTTPITIKAIRNEDNKVISAKIKYGQQDLKTNTSYSSGTNFSSLNSSNQISHEGLSITYNEGSTLVGEVKIAFNGQQITANMEALRDCGITAIYLSSSLKGNTQLNADYYSKLDKNKRIDNVISALKVIEPNLTGLALHSNNGQVYLVGDVGLGIKIPIGFLGEGVEKLLGILLAIEANKDSIILIDEIENGIHYETFPTIWSIIYDIAEKNRTQLFITTHSYEALIGIAKGKGKGSHVSYYRLDKTEDKTDVTHYDFDTLISALENSLEVR